MWWDISDRRDNKDTCRDKISRRDEPPKKKEKGTQFIAVEGNKEKKKKIRAKRGKAHATACKRGSVHPGLQYSSSDVAPSRFLAFLTS